MPEMWHEEEYLIIDVGGKKRRPKPSLFL